MSFFEDRQATRLGQTLARAAFRRLLSAVDAFRGDSAFGHMVIDVALQQLLGQIADEFGAIVTDKGGSGRCYIVRRDVGKGD